MSVFLISLEIYFVGVRSSPFQHIVPFYTPIKRKKAFGFLTFPGVQKLNIGLIKKFEKNTGYYNEIYQTKKRNFYQLFLIYLLKTTRFKFVFGLDTYLLNRYFKLFNCFLKLCKSRMLSWFNWNENISLTITTLLHYKFLSSKLNLNFVRRITDKVI